MRRIVAAGAAALVAVGLGVFAVAGRPELVGAGEPGAYGFAPGELVADFDYRAIDGRRGSLADLLEGREALVIALRTAECPVSLKYGHRLAELERSYGDRVAFLFLDMSEQDTEAKIRRDIETFGFTGPYVSDTDARIGGLIRARVSSEVFVIDASRTLRYRGAVDDQFGLTFDNPRVRNAYLTEAIDAVLERRKVPVPETEASGCALTLADATVPRRELTYHSRISRIVQENCVACHRSGGVAPFALDTYGQVRGFRAMIQPVVQQGLMPPWYASPEHGVWANDRRLADRDKRDLLDWIAAGAPEGDPATATGPREWPEGWQLPRAPDVVIRIPEPQAVPASGVVDYRYVYVKTDYPEDRWITMAEARPTAVAVTHHIIAYLEGPDDKPGSGGLLVGTAPGMPPSVFPEGSAKRLPRGAWLKFQLHYTPNGTPATDQSMVGLVFADRKPEHEVQTWAAANHEFEIPPHAANHQVVAELEFDRPGRIISFMPHMHLRGKAFRYELIRAAGNTEVLLDVPRYDFKWQLQYYLEQPLAVAPGDRLRTTAWYDNSEGNPANPDPSIAVAWGDQSWEEMMLGFFDWIPGARQKGPGQRPARASGASP